jgi:hypothetical protein
LTLSPHSLTVGDAILCDVTPTPAGIPALGSKT